MTAKKKCKYLPINCTLYDKASCQTFCHLTLSSLIIFLRQSQSLSQVKFDDETESNSSSRYKL